MPHDCQQPGTGRTPERFEVRECAQKCFLDNIFRVFVAAGQPAGEVIRRREMRCNLVVKAA
jgi:hypothetical protein